MFVWTTSLPALPLRVRPKEEPAERNKPAPDSRSDRAPKAPESRTEQD